MNTDAHPLVGLEVFWIHAHSLVLTEAVILKTCVSVRGVGKGKRTKV